MVKILCFAGSLRKASYNKMLVKIGMEGAKEAGAEVTYIDLKDYPLPIYDEDIENEAIPENVHKLKELFWSHDALLISAPEYNSSISGALKNVIDWVSRSTKQDEKPLSCFRGKVAGLMSASPGFLGGLRGLATVRSILENIQVICIPTQVAIGKAGEAFTDQGGLRDEKKQKQVQNLGKELFEVTRKLSS